ncbi:NAD(P)-dependent alcohol dehydrogenase [Amycolatopsis jejuensis]|uniref:NAD(P)-dependent alcohol dehydrogenase n=1 Tax=Amycolatopsis jejuensis TaxID=330084 RepID=UPI00052671F3|nr:NAD(P)-dependent alcohol dehydrogenase [Amycolatopsis jejuensis]
MKALQYRTIGLAPEIVEIPDPEPGPGQVLVKVTAAGLCRSDLSLMRMTAQQLMFPLPMTLGHEGVGTVAALGEGATGVTVGDQVAVYGPWGCGACPACAAGRENYCPHARRLGIRSPGLGAPGALAQYLLVDDARHLIPCAGLDPVAAVSLTDAGLTPYHAVKWALPALAPGSTAAVIGVGGLGHIAIQLLRALTPARVVALDVNEGKLALAREVGAHETLVSDESAAPAIRALTSGLGAAAVFDFVGVEATGRIAVASAAAEARVLNVGLGGGAMPMGFLLVPPGMSAYAPYWGTRGDLIEVIALAEAGAITVRTETYPLDEAPLAYERLDAGKVHGRAVILPNG